MVGPRFPHSCRWILHLADLHNSIQHPRAEPVWPGDNWDDGGWGTLVARHVSITG